MPPTLPPKDIWNLYRTAVLKLPLTCTPECDMMNMSTATFTCIAQQVNIVSSAESRQVGALAVQAVVAVDPI